MKKNDLLAAIQTALAIMDAEEAPESRDYLSGLVPDDEITEIDPYLAANKLL